MPDPAATSTGAQSPLVDAQHPWLGLLPLKEEHAKFFFGRDAEIAEILVRIRENTLTILFGQSGLGKTSLLGAAVVPGLVAANFAPVLVRLDYATGAPSLITMTCFTVVSCARTFRRIGSSEASTRTTLSPAWLIT